MPVVTLKLTPDGLTREKKARLVAGVTDLLARELGKKPEHTHVLIETVSEEDWGFAGGLTDAYRAGDRPANGGA